MKKGFTLIEIIVTIGLIAIFGYVLVSNISSVFNNEQDKQYEQFVERLETAACTYIDLDVAASKKATCKSTGSCTVMIHSILTQGLITDEDLVNPNTKERISTSKTVTIQYINGVKTCTLENVD